MDGVFIGRYEVKEKLGQGGMAVVYSAYDPLSRRDVAIKLMLREILSGQFFRSRFAREAHTVASLEHPAIVPVYDVGEHEGQPYLVMRLMKGGSLESYLKEHGPLTMAETLVHLQRLAAALEMAHSRGIVHRDLKPANLLLDEHGKIYISDFGIARSNQPGEGTLRGSGLVGTPGYMSPEQIQGSQEVDGRSDLYSLGVILYQMLAGRAPFPADMPAKAVAAHLTLPVPPIGKLRPELPSLVNDVLQRALAKDREERYQTATEMAAAFEKILPQGMDITDEKDPALSTRPALEEKPVGAGLEEIDRDLQGRAAGHRLPYLLYILGGVTLVVLAALGWIWLNS